jgi:hypothetical protein
LDDPETGAWSSNPNGTPRMSPCKYIITQRSQPESQWFCNISAVNAMSCLKHANIKRHRSFIGAPSPLSGAPLVF